jgi:Phosphotransferase enzyme family
MSHTPSQTHRYSEVCRRGQRRPLVDAGANDELDLPETQLLSGSDYRLEHADFYPRNILVDIIDDDRVEITGILDWDLAHIAPPVLALTIPSCNQGSSGRKKIQPHTARFPAHVSHRSPGSRRVCQVGRTAGHGLQRRIDMSLRCEEYLLLAH